jgi:hypothetical protein
MPGLTNTNTTQAIANKRDGREFDEISDAVDEGWCSTATSLTAGLQISDTAPLPNSERPNAEALGRCVRVRCRKGQGTVPSIR